MKLCIDPGHGMSNARTGVYDPGAVSGTHQEASIALIWAHELRKACEALGVPVWMTRADASDAAPVGTRAARALQAGCTHFVSIHLNAASPEAQGVETVYEGTPKARFAEGIQNLLVRELGLRNRKTKWATVDLKRNLAVLRFAGPCALIELGFITNASDVGVLLTDEVRIRTCRALAEHLAQVGGLDLPILATGKKGKPCDCS